MYALTLLAAVLLLLSMSQLLLQHRKRQLSIELIAPTWRRLAETNRWQFIDGTFGVCSRLEGTLHGYDFTAVTEIEEGRILLSVPLRSPLASAETWRVTLSSFSEVDFMRTLEEAVVTARERDDALEASWSALARLHSLTFSTLRGECALRGEIDGHAVRIGTHSEPVETILRVKIGAPWPDTLLIQSRGDGDSATATTGNPILDSLVTISAPDEIAVQAALRDPSVVGDLLAVLHPFPRSSVVGGFVQMNCPERLRETLPERLADVMQLARRLQSLASS
ncbi:MAG: hypothetical protein P8R54_06655 [Myxococcota bacterium]|nr:hypothetical protein [Myxococcota bacterium]